jgi:hypothetical protein
MPEGGVGMCMPWTEGSVRLDTPDYLWEKNKTSIVVLKGGLFEISVSYSAPESDIALLINGEPMFISTDRVMGGQVSKKHSLGSIIGSSIQTNVTIPPKSRIAV